MTIVHARILPVLVAGLLGFSLTPAFGSTFETGDAVRISPLHEIDDDFYAFSNQIVVDGTVLGDFTGCGSQATIRGTIRRSANFCCRYTEHNGSIGGSLRWLGERLTVSGRVGGSILAAGRAITLNQGSVVEKDVTARAAEINLDGNILGKVDCAGGTIRITGQIGGDVELKADQISIEPPAVIRGNLIYVTKNKDQLILKPGVKIIGTTTWQEPELSDDGESSVLTDIAFSIAQLLATFIFGIIVIRFFGRYAEESFNQLRSRPTVALAAGLLGLLGLAFAVVVLALALIGAAAGSILLSGDLAILGIVLLVMSILMIPISSFATVSGAVVFYSGMIVAGLVLGHLILKAMRPGTTTLSKSALFLGLIILTVASSLPFVGIVVYLMALLTGAGAIMLGLHHGHRKSPAIIPNKS